MHHTGQNQKNSLRYLLQHMTLHGIIIVHGTRKIKLVLNVIIEPPVLDKAPCWIAKPAPIVTLKRISVSFLNY